MIGTAVGLSEVQDNVALGIQLQFSLVNVGAAAFHHSLESNFAVVVTQASRMVLGHRHSEAPLESSGIAARRGIPFLPSNGLHSFLKHFDRSV